MIIWMAGDDGVQRVRHCDRFEGLPKYELPPRENQGQSTTIGRSHSRLSRGRFAFDVGLRQYSREKRRAIDTTARLLSKRYRHLCRNSRSIWSTGTVRGVFYLHIVPVEKVEKCACDYD